MIDRFWNWYYMAYCTRTEEGIMCCTPSTNLIFNIGFYIFIAGIFCLCVAGYKWVKIKINAHKKTQAHKK